ncbi:type 2 isopentenyl-diphosphate Delta-isomerase [Niallia sp. 03190]|uniref:type 2 isopentenyl-diphosphate Delta-isomerase n=1 Tax=Niallia sp. 03190 TaxID=3458061 RepID=UPI004043F52C
MKDKNIEQRKSEHIEICLYNNVNSSGITNGLENYYFIHQALPEIDFQEIDISTDFLGKRQRTPFLISSMTGGTKKAYEINKNLAAAAEENGWALALGSTRSALEKEDMAYTFQLRKYAPTTPIIANLGAVQLNYGYGIEECQKIIELTEADALVLHLNSLQEVIQTEGNTNFKQLLLKIKKVCSNIQVPVGIKEVGWGINGQLAKRLMDCGIQFVDVAGAGGTSWTEVEKNRSTDSLKILAAQAFADWGIPTAECIIDCRKENESGVLIASGGLHTGVDAAKALALGANMVGFGRTILKDAVDSKEKLLQTFNRIEFELKLAMFGIGAESLKNIHRSSLKKK